MLAACSRDQDVLPAPTQPTAAAVALAPTEAGTPVPSAMPTTRATSTPTATPLPTATRTPTPTPTPISPLSIQYLREQEFPGSDIVIEQTLAPGSNYDRYYASYFSEGLKQYGLLTVPRGRSQPPAGR